MWPFKCEQFKIRLWHYSHAVHAKNRRHQASESYVRCLKVLCCYTFDHISCMRLSHKYRKWPLLPLNILKRGQLRIFRSFKATYDWGACMIYGQMYSNTKLSNILHNSQMLGAGSWHARHGNNTTILFWIARIQTATSLSMPLPKPWNSWITSANIHTYIVNRMLDDWQGLQKWQNEDEFSCHLWNRACE